MTMWGAENCRSPFVYQSIEKKLERLFFVDTRRIRMAITLNPDKKVVEMIREGLKQTGGYCPCRLERTEENKCMCQEFKDQIADPEFEGYCHCMLYYKDNK